MKSILYAYGAQRFPETKIFGSREVDPALEGRGRCGFCYSSVLLQNCTHALGGCVCQRQWGGNGSGCNRKYRPGISFKQKHAGVSSTQLLFRFCVIHQPRSYPSGCRLAFEVDGEFVWRVEGRGAALLRVQKIAPGAVVP